MPKTNTVAASSSSTPLGNVSIYAKPAYPSIEPYVKDLPYVTDEDFSDLQLKYLAEIPVKQGQRVYYVNNEEILIQFSEKIKQNQWLSLLNDKDALHVALGAFILGRKINYWELVTFINIFQISKRFRPSAGYSFSGSFKQQPLFRKGANDKLIWSEEALKSFIPGYYKIFEKNVMKSLPPGTPWDDPKVEKQVKLTVEEKMEELFNYIAEHCPSNQQFFIEFKDRPFGFNFNDHSLLMSDIFMAIHIDQGRVDIAPCMPKDGCISTIFHPFALLNAIGEFTHQKDYVTPLPKLGLFGSRRLYGTIEVKQAFGVQDYRPVDLFFQSNIPHLLEAHYIKSSFYGILIHDLWHCLSDSAIPLHEREFIKMMARALRDRKIEVNNKLATEFEQSFIDKQTFYGKKIDEVLSNSLRLYSKIGDEVYSSDEDFIFLIVFYEMAIKRYLWMDRTTIDPWGVKFSYYNEDRFPHFAWMLEKLNDKSKYISDFYELWLVTLTECSHELLVNETDKDKMFSLRRMIIFMHSLIEKIPDRKTEIKGLVNKLQKLHMESSHSDIADAVSLIEEVENKANHRFKCR